MADSFIPSTSVDSYTTPMEVQIPLLQDSSNLEDSRINNGLKSDTNKPKTISSIVRLVDDYEKPSGQSIIRTPSIEPETPKFSDKLFVVGQVKTLAFYQALLSEFIGTMLLTLVCTSTGLPIGSTPIPDLHGALASGFIVATVIVGFGHTSGAHINPAVTVSFLVAGEIDFVRAFFYIVAQLLGAISASSLLSLLVPAHTQGNLGMTMVTPGVSLSHAVVVEFIITFILCYTVHAICDKRRDDIGGSKALAVGLAVTIGCLFGGPFTGAAMNPARSFGPVVIMNAWKNHWIYWLGPLSGSIIAAIIYTRVLKSPKQPSAVVVIRDLQ